MLLKLLIGFVLLMAHIIVCSSNTIILFENDDIKQKIEQGQPDDIFKLQDGKYVTFDTISIPSGVTIEGGNKSIIYPQFVQDSMSVFDVSNTTKVTIKNLTIKLSNQARGITTKQNNFTTNLQIMAVNIEGKKFPQNVHEAPSIGISLYGVNQVDISASKFKNIVGGVYVTGDNVLIKDNFFKQVNFGNISIDGSHIKILSNEINESGKATPFSPGTGDAITINSGSSDLLIENNFIDTGYCYLIWAHASCKNIKIHNNILKSGITTGIYIEKSKNIEISNNEFRSNFAYGVAIMDSCDQVLIDRNKFIGNGLVVEDTVFNAEVKNNEFEQIPYTLSALNISNAISHNNSIKLMDENATSKLEIFFNEHSIQKSESIAINKQNIVIFQVKNTGNQLLKLTGRPQIQLSPHPLPSDFIGINDFGSSIFNNFIVHAYEQPTKLTLEPGEMTQFTLRYCHNAVNENNELIINIPTDNNEYNPFWFRVRMG